jgi:hypothetical protein
MTEVTPAKRGRPAGFSNRDLAFTQYVKALTALDGVEETIRAEVERRAALAEVDRQAALARFEIYGGKIVNDRPVNDDGTPYSLPKPKTAEPKSK